MVGITVPSGTPPSPQYTHVTITRVVTNSHDGISMQHVTSEVTSPRPISGRSKRRHRALQTGRHFPGNMHAHNAPSPTGRRASSAPNRSASADRRASRAGLITSR